MRFQLPTLPHWLNRASRTALLCGAMGTYFLGMAGFSTFAVISSELPNPDRLFETTRPPSIQIVDRQGRDLALRGAHHQPPMAVEDLPAHLRMAVLATEDRRFYAHSGIDPYALARATVRNLKARRVVEGGSTLTQQIAKNVFLTPDQTLKRKGQEMMIAVWLERRHSKSELLRLYLSRVYFGSGAWGVEAASDVYFERPPDELSLAEAAMLAGLLKSPSSRNPLSSPERAAERTRLVLRLMDRRGLLDEGVLETALAETLSVSRPRENVQAGHFIDWIWPLVEDQVGDAPRDLVIQVTLDAEVQQAALSALSARLNADRGANEGAVVVLDQTGSVIAMAGGQSYQRSQFNRAVSAERQPGSSFKPIVYLAALRAGLSPWSERIDQPTNIEGWEPENFTEDFRGNMRIEDALAQSINTIAAQLIDEVGPDAVVATAADLGLEGLSPFPSLALGAQAVSPLDMAEAYLPFASSGVRPAPYGVLSIATADGTPIYDHERTPGPIVVSAQEIRLMNRMLVRAVESGTGRRARVDGQMIAGKTGTTNDNRDAWFVGYAAGLSAAVWVGDDENKPMQGITGGTIPAEIFSDVMATALADRPKARLPVAEEPDWARQDAAFATMLERLERVVSEGQNRSHRAPSGSPDAPTTPSADPGDGIRP